MFDSESFDALCGVGVPRPNFQRLIAYVEPNEQQQEQRQEENNPMQLWHRRKAGNSGGNSASSISETRLRCPDNFVRATVVEVNPQTGQPMSRAHIYHRSLWPRLLVPNSRLSRRPKLMDIRQERLKQQQEEEEKHQGQNHLEIIWSPRSPRRLKERLKEKLKEKLKEEKAWDPNPIQVRNKAQQTEEEPGKLTLSKATSVSGSNIQEDLSQRKGIPALDMELRRMLSQYGVSAAQLTQRLQRIVGKEEEELLARSTSHKEQDGMGDESDVTVTWSRAVRKANASASGDGDSVTPDTSVTSSLATDSQEINELSTAAGLTAAFARRHKRFQLLARLSRSPSPRS
ncbi:probable inactive protein kinase DDB_G0270444 [Drosophila takahashii]|uniref:probable inactive protein kinase DDB_G0270444 n=1 Tax=Drosophila takahashii TaxID=29030 RepID=UPI0038992D8A